MRRGAGRVRHIATPTLWIQKLVFDGVIIVNKVDGKKNQADMGTKQLSYTEMMRHMSSCGPRFERGQSRLALAADAARP
eukprot:11468803-Karenia_brevis.AAC.1